MDGQALGLTYGGLYNTAYQWVITTAYQKRNLEGLQVFVQ